MARSRAAASTALTLGVALATLVAMGAILAGPMLADCAGDSLATCLRDRIATPTEPPRPAGWIEANATEYAPPPPAAATLTAPAGTLALSGHPAPVAPPAPAAVLAAPPGQLSAALAPPRAASPAPVALEPTGQVAATGAAGGDAASPTAAALAAPAGSLSAGRAPVPPPISSAVELKAPEKTISSPIRAPKIEVKLAPPVVRFDPAFPNVVVLPAPNTGADSSIRTLAAD